MRRFAILFLIMPAWALPQAAKTTYNFVSLGAGRVALGISDRGQVLTIGTDGLPQSVLFTANGQRLPFVFKDKLTGQNAYPTALNARNEFVGEVRNGSLPKGDVLYQNGTSGGAERLQIVKNAAPNSITSATGINDAGAIIGTYAANLESYQTGVLYQHGETTTISFPGSLVTTPYSINDSGVIAGWFSDAATYAHGFVYTPSGLGGGKYVQFDMPYAIFTELDGINNLGELAGNYIGMQDVGRGVVYSNGKGTTINYPGSPDQIIITGINEQGQLCGYLQGSGIAFVATPNYLSGF